MNADTRKQSGACVLGDGAVPLARAWVAGVGARRAGGLARWGAPNKREYEITHREVSYESLFIENNEKKQQGGR